MSLAIKEKHTELSLLAWLQPKVCYNISEGAEEAEP